MLWLTPHVHVRTHACGRRRAPAAAEPSGQDQRLAGRPADAAGAAVGVSAVGDGRRCRDARCGGA
eukprot:365957-Chlamydomonas_euryale.AAC.4